MAAAYPVRVIASLGRDCPTAHNPNMMIRFLTLLLYSYLSQCEKVLAVGGSVAMGSVKYRLNKRCQIADFRNSSESVLSDTVYSFLVRSLQSKCGFKPHRSRAREGELLSYIG
jgi:hypothetical protein